MDQKMKIFYGLLLLTMLCQFVHSSPVETKLDDDDYLADADDDKSEYDYDDDKLSSPTSSSSGATEKPFVTIKEELKSDAGKTVTLKCKGEALGSDPLIMWYNGSQLLFQARSRNNNNDDKRVELSEKEGDLVISNVNSYDESIYRCRVYGEKENYETIVDLQINGPPHGVSISEHSQKNVDISGTTLHYHVGKKNLEFTCNVSKSRPSAKIDWIHNGNTILEAQTRDHELKIEENVLLIRSVHARHAGEYQCEASNELGTEKASFTVEVEYQPIFMHQTPYFNTEEGEDAELHCIYKAFPAPTQVKWMKGGAQIHANDKYDINNDVKDHHDRTKLIIRNVDKNDVLYSYQCIVENSLGKKEENVTLGFGPAPAKFVDYTYINGNVHIDYTVKSRQKITDVVVLYRNNKNGFKPKVAKITNLKQVENSFEWKVQGTIELEHGNWEIQTRFKNTDGWSEDSFMQQVSIKIPKESTESQNQTSSAVNVGHTIFGLFCMLLLQRLV